jgi:DNA-directed RNA polymerase specialized sigma24 family protein
METLEQPVSIAREVRFEEIYEATFPGVAAFVRKMHGSLQDAKDIFHDALVIYFEKRAGKNLSISISEEAYVIGIAKHLWIRKFNHELRSITLTKAETAIQIPGDFFPSVNTKRLFRLIEASGKKCLDLLSAFYYEHFSVKDLVHKFGFSSEHSASVQKYKCIEKIRETLKRKSISYDDFLE